VAKIAYSRKALADLERLEDFAPGALELIVGAIEMLADHPLVGREAEEELRELVVSRGKTGYVVLYDFAEIEDAILIGAVRHQRELRNPEFG